MAPHPRARRPHRAPTTFRPRLLRLEDLTLPSGLFGSPIVIPTGSANLHSLTAGDFNGDHRLDLITTNYSPTDRSVPAALGEFVADGQGGYSPAGNSPIDTGTHDALYDITTGDFNNDGKLDVAVINVFADAIQIWLGDGQGGFKLHGSVSVNTGGPFFLAAADFNHDGNLDLVTGTTNGIGGTGPLKVLLGDGTGGFSVNMFDALSYPEGVTTGDFDHNGTIDVATYTIGGAIIIYSGDGKGGFTRTGSYNPLVGNTGLSPLGPHALAAGDFNNDGQLDLAMVGFNGSTGYVGVLAGDGHGSFSVEPTQAISNNDHPTSVVAADFNGDGATDLFVVAINLDGSPGTPQVLLGNGRGAFSDGGAITGVVAGEQNETGLVLGDFNGDGKPDVAVADRSSGNVDVLINQSQAKIDTQTSLESSPHPSLMGQPVTFTATVTPTIGTESKPSGAVTFLDNGTPFGSANLDSNGEAAVTAGGDSALSQGMHEITAVYGGDTLFVASRSLDLGQDVRDPTTTQLNLSASTLVKGQPITLTATMASTISSPFAPGGNMQFNVIRGGITIGGLSIPIVNGRAQVSSSQLSVGLADNDQISAWYLGDVKFAPSQAPAQTLTVRQAKTFTWSGLGPDNLWSDGANWVGGIAPAPGDSLIFPAGAEQLHNVNDFSPRSQFYSLTFTFPSAAGSAATDIYVTGAPIDLGTGGITVNAPSPGPFLGAAIAIGSVPASAVRFSPDVQLDSLLPTFISVENDTELDLDGHLTAGSGNISVPGSPLGGIIKSGSGTLNLLNSNSYSGPTLIQQGNVGAEAPGALGSGAVAVRQLSTLSLFGGNSFANPLVLAGRLVSHGEGDAWSGPIALSGPSATVDVRTSGLIFQEPLTLSGTMTGSARLRKIGRGTLLLAGHNAYIGRTDVQSGTLSVQDSAGLGTSTGGAALVEPGATLELAGGINVNHTLVLTDPTASLRSVSGNNVWSGPVTLGGKDPIEVVSDQLLISGKIQAGGLGSGVAVTLIGLAGLLKSGTGELILTHANSLNSTAEVAEGVLDLRNAGALGTAFTQVLTGATLAVDVSSPATFGNRLFVSGDGFQNQGALHLLRNTCTWSGNLTLLGLAVVSADVGAHLIVPGLHGGDLAKIGAGDLAITGPSDNSGATFVIEGSLTVQSAKGLAPTSEGVTVYRDAMLSVVAPVNTTWSIDLPLTLLQGSSVSAGGVTWNGPITLAGAATVFVPIHRSARLAGFISGTDGATLIKAGPGNLSLDGPAGATFAAVIGPSGMNQIDVQAGTLVLKDVSSGPLGFSSTASENLNLSLAGGFIPDVGQPIDLIHNETGQPVSGAFAGLPEGSVIFVDGLGFRITYRGGDSGRDVVITRIALQAP